MLCYHRNYQKWGHKLNGKYRFEFKKWDIIKYKNLLSNIKARKEILKFGKIEIEKYKSCHYKSPISSKDVVTENVLESNKISSGEKNIKTFYIKTILGSQDFYRIFSW